MHFGHIDGLVVLVQLVELGRRTVGSFLDFIEGLISVPATAENNKYLAGPFAPVEAEHEATPCKVTGQLPAALNGEFARNGPNAKLPPTDGYHWFDGDGMVHAVRIKNGTATYSNRYIRTVRLETEIAAGRALYFKIGELFSRNALVHVMIDKRRRALGICRLEDDKGCRGNGGVANTSLVVHAKKLLALMESDLPYVLKVMRDGVIETIGQTSYEGRLVAPFTAHPKILNGSMYGIGYNLQEQPHLTFFVIDSSGRFERSFPIELARPSMMHDMAITERLAVLLDFSIVLDAKKMAEVGMPIGFDSNKKSRIGLLPLDATSGEAVRWFELPEPIACLHTVNAWEEKLKLAGPTGGKEEEDILVHVIFGEMKTLSFDHMAKGSVASRDELPDVVRYTINLTTGKVSKITIARLQDVGLDLPRIAPGYLGRKNRYGYFAQFDVHGQNTGFVKVDLQKAHKKEDEGSASGGGGGGVVDEAVMDRVDFGGSRVGGEVVFVPDLKRSNGWRRSSAPPAEDAGFLTTFVLDDALGTSELVVWDAQKISAGPVATVAIPARVPAGFHAIWLTEKEIEELEA